MGGLKGELKGEPKQLIVINPVVESLLGEYYQNLVEELRALGWYVETSKRGIPVVRQRYADHLKSTLIRPVIDSRCPAVVQMINEEFPHLTRYLAPIKPVLITGAELALQEFKEKHREEDVIMSVVTPCEAFNIFNTPTQRMITWKSLRFSLHLSFPQKTLEVSPVPLGFFDSLGVKVYKASGEKDCRNLLANIPDDAELLELLWCKGGCHKGDGL